MSIGNNNSLGTGLVTFAASGSPGAVLEDDGRSAITLANNILLAAGANPNIVNAISPVTPFTLSGNISGPGNLTKGFTALPFYENTMNAAQTLTFTGAVSGTSTFTLTLDGATTANITYTSNSQNLATAINSAFSTLASSNNNANIFSQYNPIAVSNGTTGAISIAFQNVPVGANVGVTPYLSVSALVGGGTAAIGQTLGTGTVVLSSVDTYSGTTIINHGTVSLSGGGSLASQGTSVNAVQTITFTTAATAGTFTLSFNGQTATIPFNATAATAQPLLTALTTIGANNLVVSGTGGPNVTGQTLIFTFVNALGGAAQPLITANLSGLTGGTTGAPVNTTPGSSSINVNVGAALLLDNTGTNNVNRINDAQTLALNGGTFNFLANAGANTVSSETVGRLPSAPARASFRPAILSFRPPRPRLPSRSAA